jgi:type II secretory pathway pseudopilin PulG
MVELLVVLGIILILIGLFFAGAKVVTGQAKARDTKSMLETAKTMFANYQQQDNLAMFTNTANNYTGPKGALPVTMSNFTSGNSSLIWSEGLEQAPGSVTLDALQLTNSGHGTLPPAIANTEAMMHAMLTIHENQTIINNLPSSKVVKDAVSGIPLLLDGYGNPIIFVFGGGLTGVWVDPSYGQTEVITTERVQPNGYDPTSTKYVAAGQSISNRPFFASAGPDGDMSNAHGYSSGTPTSDMTDDNVYSFQQ